MLLYFKGKDNVNPKKPVVKGGWNTGGWERESSALTKNKSQVLERGHFKRAKLGAQHALFKLES